MHHYSLEIIILLSIATNPVIGQVREVCEATVINGTVFGTTVETVNPQRSVCAYLGIPFATPPLEALRFQPPRPAQGWSDGLNATTQPRWCPQPPTDLFPIPPETVISEDCLQLNVFQPRVENTTYVFLPVLIWFHGGGFLTGSADQYAPTRLLARNDIILVVPQYRLGVLGFLSTGNEWSPGNYALKDQALSIRWVKENIAAFGGNPEQITIAGESAGGVAAMFQFLSPVNKGLLNGVIAQSGFALSYWVIDHDPFQSAKIIADVAGCPDNSSSELIVSCLKETNWEKFLSIPILPVPVVELPHETAFMTSEPLEILTNGAFPDIPVIIGANKNDGSFILADLYKSEFGPKGLDKDPDFMRNGIVPFLLRFLKNEEDGANRAISSSFELAYLSGVNRSSWSESMPGLVDMLTAAAFKSAALHPAELLSKHNSTVYLYSFEHHGNNSLWKGPQNPDPPPVDYGIAHGDDLIYLFDFPANLSAEDFAFSEIICDLWSNFVIFGNPTPFDDERYSQWTPYDQINESYMKLNGTPTIYSDYHSSWRPNGKINSRSWTR